MCKYMVPFSIAFALLWSGAILPAVGAFSLVNNGKAKATFTITITKQRRELLLLSSLSTTRKCLWSTRLPQSQSLSWTRLSLSAGTGTGTGTHPLESTAETTTTTSQVVTTARVAFVAGSALSNYGATSPLPNPSWYQVAQQLAKRLPNFVQQKGDEASSSIQTVAISLTADSPPELPSDTKVIVALGVTTRTEQDKLNQLLKSTTNVQAVLCDPTCASEIFQNRFAGSYKANGPMWDSFITSLAPWTELASHKRLLQKTDTLLARKSSEDYIFAVLFTLHALVMTIDVVKSDINPSWEKGPVRNIQEFSNMVQCCGPQIQAALTDPKSKRAIDLLNQLDLRDQVGSYRVIVSNETPQLEDFTLCILQQNNCFQCDSPILQQPRVPLMSEWRGKPLDQNAARQILMGQLDHPESAGGSQPYSWKIVVGANPAYDAFPMQHQIFYPSDANKQAMWYDPVFCVETLEGDLVWCKRHYRCTPRKHWSGNTVGAWTLTTLDNGMVSEEHWTTVDAADDLSWAVLHYSGAARRAGQSYVGALLCSRDGLWPSQAPPGSVEWDRIQKAFLNCDLELWELFGGSVDKSYMWSSKFTDWAKSNPPPLERIGDMSITTWRKRMRESEGTAK